MAGTRINVVDDVQLLFIGVLFFGELNLRIEEAPALEVVDEVEAAFVQEIVLHSILLVYRYTLLQHAAANLCAFDRDLYYWPRFNMQRVVHTIPVRIKSTVHDRDLRRIARLFTVLVAQAINRTANVLSGHAIPAVQVRVLFHFRK